MTSYELITKHDSPNFWPRYKYGAFGDAPTGITIHHWGEEGQKFENVVNHLCRPNGTTSAHVVVEDGRVAWLIDAKYAAFHSGSTVGNGTTVGIECRPEATQGDYETVAELIRDIRAEYGNLPLYPHRHWHATLCPGKWDLARLDRMARTLGMLSTTKPDDVETEDDDMALSDADIEKIAKRAADHVYDREFKGDDGKPVKLAWLMTSYHAIENDRIAKAVTAIKKVVGL